MTTQPKPWRRTAGIYIFFGGILLGMFFALLLTWADFEASLFYAIPDSSALQLESLRCPLLLTRHETGAISATFTNPADVARRRTVDTYITHGFVIAMREERVRFDLAPGEKYTHHWPIAAEDAAWGRFILARLYVQRNNPLPARTGSCGVLVVDLPYLSGGQIVAATLTASLLLMGGGAALWLRGDATHSRHLRTVDYLTLSIAPVTLLTLLFSLMGIWFLSGILLVLIFLLIVSIVTWVLN